MDGDCNMANKNKKENKFNFVSVSENNEVIDEEIEFGEETIKEEKDFSEKSLKEVVEENLNNLEKKPTVVDNSYSVNRKKHISFEFRVAFRIICMLLLLGISCYFILEAVNFGKKDKVNYNEITEVDYSVCLNENNYNNCLNEGLEYTNASKFINIDFKYNADYSKKVEYDLAYHLVGIFKVYDKDNNTKVLFKDEDVLVERTSIRDISNVISFTTKAELNFKDYEKIAKEYKSKYGNNSDTSLEVVLYLDKDKETKDIASVIIPLGEQKFKITKNELNNLNQTEEYDNNIWNDYNSLCAIIATVLILIALLILYRTTRLVLKVTNNKSKYEARLSQILKDYDRQIVNAKDGYELDPKKKIVRVSTFSELLDAHDNLRKPIIYSKINSVKSEFIVEDDKKSYKYILKDTDV